MKISKQQLDSLLKMLALTNDAELDCDSCFRLLSEFAETSLAGKSIPEGLKSIEHHLEICNECCEEFEALKDALSQETDQ